MARVASRGHKAPVCGIRFEDTALSFAFQQCAIEGGHGFETKLPKLNLLTAREHYIKCPVLPCLQPSPGRLSTQEHSKAAAASAIKLMDQRFKLAGERDCGMPYRRVVWHWRSFPPRGRTGILLFWVAAVVRFLLWCC